ncbi:MAG: hypothetical protein KJ630_04430 [Proteobacteria bacterium]|nr:hypothetical protein [Pseudomonadota bacterium]
MSEQKNDATEHMIDSMIAMAFWMGQSKKRELLDSNFDVKNDWYKKTKKILSIGVALLLLLLFTWFKGS